MWKRDFPPIEGPPPYASDPVIEAYKKDVDRSLIRENLKRTVEERLRDLDRLQRQFEELAAAGRRAGHDRR